MKISDEELKVYGYAPGLYQGKCHRCHELVMFLDKRATVCRDCAISLYKQDKDSEDIYNIFPN